jgi:uroporphyrinogen decarboxylase
MPGVPDQGVIHEDDDKRVMRDCWGRLTEWHKRGHGLAENARHDIAGGLADRAAWEQLRDHFRADEPLRMPGVWDESHAPLFVLHPMNGPSDYRRHCGAPWSERVERWRTRDYWIQLHAPSMMGQIKEVMGFERYCFALYDDREMIEELMEARTILAEHLVDRIMADVDFDVLHFWEDIAFNGGPMVSPELFEELALSRYKRIIKVFKARGGEIVSIDSDGDIWSLLPGLVRAGVNHLWPLEVNARMDVVALREEYGQAFSMRGGVDKYALLKGRDAIDRELDRVAPVVAGGGYIPMLDHQIPPGIPFEDFCYYMEQKRMLLGAPAPEVAASV